MARHGAKTDDLNLSDDNTQALFASPSRQGPSKPSKPSAQQTTHQQPRMLDDHREVNDERVRDSALRKELARIRNINRVIEGAIDGLERAAGNVHTVSRTVNDASVLLNTWTRILSQTEHNQRLILDPSWGGASQDVADMEKERLTKQQEKDRQELEEAQRREARARKAEEDEQKRAENVEVEVLLVGFQARAHQQLRPGLRARKLYGLEALLDGGRAALEVARGELDLPCTACKSTGMHFWTFELFQTQQAGWT
ncbi:MAG: hypothetical protein LQ348_000242 [Seirophora lacunosa]|nr:MAG: hypothetical protein LQ348_000242 [Seirophora lacunosa]